MGNKMLVGISLVLLSQVIAATSQILLKKAAKVKYSVWWRSYLNPFVICGYFLLLVTTVITIFALKCIPLSLSAALGASGQIIVPLFSRIFLGEKISRKRLVGMMIIVLGIVIFSL